MTTLHEKVYEGLPLDTRQWELSFTLEGVSSNPTSITVVVSHVAFGGAVVEVARYTEANTDVLGHTGTGEYLLTVVPGDYGEFEIQIFTDGDEDTVHASIEFEVHRPKGPFT